MKSKPSRLYASCSMLQAVDRDSDSGSSFCMYGSRIISRRVVFMSSSCHGAGYKSTGPNSFVFW